jgi:tetratricopeptide (TPR) repeat protein
MKKIITLFCLVVSVLNAFAQDIDSLLSKIAIEKNDNLRVEMLFSFFSKPAETDPVLALKNVQKLLIYSQEKKDRISEAYAIASIGYNYRGLGNTEKSLEYGLKADAIASETGNETLMAITNNVLGNIYKDLGNNAKALKHYYTTLDIGTRLKFDKAQSLAFQNLGEVYLAIGKLDSALMYEQKDYELCMRIRFFNYFGYTLSTLGAIHSKLGNTAIALGYFDMAIQEGIKTKSPKQLNWAYTSKSQYFYTAKQIDSSLLYAKKAIATVNNTAFTNYSIKPAKLLLDIYENSNSDSAIKYFKIYKAANDSLFSTKTIQQTQLMTFENEIKQQEIAAEKTKAEEQRKQNIQYALLALGIITFIITFLMLSRRHITNTKLIQFLGVVALLVVFEFLNLLLHPFLERITHHSPVFMLLALVCIAALLVPLHHKLEIFILCQKKQNPYFTNAFFGMWCLKT